MEIHKHSLKAIRVRINLFFFFYGFIYATWASRIPAIQQSLHMSDPQLGGVLLGMPVGSFLTLPFSGFLSAKYGSKKIIAIVCIIYSCLLVCIGFSQSILLLTIALFFFGSAGNMMNIAINTQAIELEALYKRKIISSFHGVWSTAGLAAAALGTFFIGKGFAVRWHLLLVAGISLAVFLLSVPYLLQEKNDKFEKRPLFVKPDRMLWGLGIIAFCSLICQGAMFDWSGVYFKKVLVTDKTFIGFGYTAFMIAMTGIRFITDWITQKIGFKKIMILCGISATAGLLLAVAFPYLIPATIGLFLVGMGVSPAIPLVFSAAGKFKTLPPPVAIAAVSSIGMIGLLLGPAMIGFIAGATGLKISFLFLSLFAIAIIITSFFIKNEEHI